MSRKILIFNAGNARIITEAIWGLKQDKKWVPDAIHIFTTGKTHLECLEAFVTPAGSSVNRLAEVCGALGIPQPCLNLHLAKNAQKRPIHLLKEEWETEALNSLYNKVLPALFVYDQTEVVCLARSALIEMNMLLSYYAISLMRPSTDHWYSVYIKVSNSKNSEEQEKQLQRNRDFWFPKDIKLGDTELSADQIQIILKSFKYDTTKKNVLEKQLNNPGKIKRIFIDIENKTLTILANTLMPLVKMKADGSNSMSAPMNAFILQTLANMYELREQPYSNFNIQKDPSDNIQKDPSDNIQNDLSDAFFEHIEYIKRGEEGRPLLPYEESEFDGRLKTLIEKDLAPQVMSYLHAQKKEDTSIVEGASVSFVLEFDEVEVVLAQYFYLDPNHFAENCAYWWRTVPAFQWKWEKRLITLSKSNKGQEKEPEKLKARVNFFAEPKDFVYKNTGIHNVITTYIASNFFNLTKGGTYSIETDRSKLKKSIEKALPGGPWIKQLYWNSKGRLGVTADRIKFTDADYLKKALKNLLADPNTRFDKAKIQGALKNIDRYIAKPVPAA